MMTDTTANRESWLQKAASKLIPLLSEAGHEVPPVRVSVGWGGPRKGTEVRGTCWATASTEDGVNQVFVTPVQRETVTTLAVLLHELCHAVDDCQSGHVKNFITVARSVGFKSKWTSSDNRTDELQVTLEKLAEEMGEFPTAAILTGQAADAPKTQSTRQLKAVCQFDDVYKLRLTRKMIDEYGLPLCPCHQALMVEA